MLHGPTNFCTTVVKPFFQEELEPMESIEICTMPELEDNPSQPKET